MPGSTTTCLPYLGMSIRCWATISRSRGPARPAPGGLAPGGRTPGGHGPEGRGTRGQAGGQHKRGQPGGQGRDRPAGSSLSHELSSFRHRPVGLRCGRALVQCGVPKISYEKRPPGADQAWPAWQLDVPEFLGHRQAIGRIDDQALLDHAGGEHPPPDLVPDRLLHPDVLALPGSPGQPPRARLHEPPERVVPARRVPAGQGDGLAELASHVADLARAAHALAARPAAGTAPP